MGVCLDARPVMLIAALRPLRDLYSLEPAALHAMAKRVLKVETLDAVPRVPYGVVSSRHGKGALAQGAGGTADVALRNKEDGTEAYKQISVIWVRDMPAPRRVRASHTQSHRPAPARSGTAPPRRRPG